MSSYKDYPLSADTSQEAEQLMFELLAKKSAAEKLKMLSRLTKNVRQLAIYGIKQRFPNLSNTELRIKLADLLYGSEAAERVASRPKQS